ncbi:MAG TPA: hypothetical protein VK178_07095 [Opitutaceae bacterium]|nr:hypothetical protein [Opitutaceae bacterium]HLP26737.1 hypothetical protein [Acidobacteriota bacterium]
MFLFDKISIRMIRKYGVQAGDPLRAARSVAVVQPIVLKAPDTQDWMMEIPAAFDLSPEEAQQFMDELWRVGIRPTEGAGSVGQMAATTRHLEDMRAVAFAKLGVVKP